MDRREALSLLTLGGILALGGCQERDPSPNATRFAGVMASGVLRAGYVSYPPGTIVSPAGEASPSGIFPDLLRAIGEAAEWKVEFTGEVGYADILESLAVGRFDIIGGVWANPNRAKGATISRPVYYSGLGVWVRRGENRFSPDGRWSSINKSDIRIGAIDGSSPIGVIRSQFSDATLVSYPNLTSESQLFLDLVQRRVDVVLAEPTQGILYSNSNPGNVQNIAEEQPIRVFQNVFLMPPNEGQFKTFIDAAISDQLSSGKISQLIAQYQPVEGAFYSAAPGYLVP